MLIGVVGCLGPLLPECVRCSKRDQLVLWVFCRHGCGLSCQWPLGVLATTAGKGLELFGLRVSAAGDTLHRVVLATAVGCM